MWSGVRMEPHHHMAEFFSGKAEVSAAFRELGKSCVSYDIEYCGKAMDYLEPGGYAVTCHTLNFVDMVPGSVDSAL